MTDRSEWMRMHGPEPSSAEEALAAGSIVGGRYVLVHELGRGASGAVWRATHRLLGSDVAIKFLAASSNDAHVAELLLERFRFEAQVSARLAKRTDKIVAVHDGGLFGELPYIVMDLVEGESLETAVDRQALDPLTVARVAEDVAEALEASHAEEIAHRDVKPANILAVRGPHGLRYKLADFGVAKLFGAEPKGLATPRATAEQTLVGSPAYMSPEAISADRTTNGQGDLWSLAVTLYEALTQAFPFEGETWPTIAVAIMARRYTPPSRVLGACGAPFDAFFAKAFAEKLDARFQTARELSAAFCAAAREERNALETSPSPPTAPPPDGPAADDTFSAVEEPTSRPPARQRRGRLAVAAAVLIALSLAGAALVSRPRDDARSPAPQSEPERSVRELVPTPESTPPVAPPPAPEVKATRAPTASASFTGRPRASTSTHGAESAALAAPLAPEPTFTPAIRSAAPPPSRTIDPSETQ